MEADDRRNCNRNLIAVAGADGRLESGEKDFFLKVSEKLNISSRELPILFQEVQRDGILFYPIQSREFAAKTLKMMLAMARVDGSLDVSEKRIITAFSKAIEQDRESLASHVAESGEERSPETPVETSAFSSIAICVITDHFEKLDEFIEALQPMDVVQASYLDFLRDPTGDVVFMHATEKRKATVGRLEKMQASCSMPIVPVMNRFQGAQIKYAHELGLSRCMIEPMLKTEVVPLFDKIFPEKR